MHDDIPLTVGRVTRVLTELVRPAIYTDSVPFDVKFTRCRPSRSLMLRGLALNYEPYTGRSAAPVRLSRRYRPV
jgi:alpha-mannosidase